MVTRILDRTIDAAKKGSADLLILALVDEQDLHGYEIGRLIELRSAGTLHFTMASLYVLLNLTIDVLYGIIDARVRIEA